MTSSMRTESPELLARLGISHSAEELELLGAIIGKYVSLPSGLRQTLADQLWASIPTYIDESLYLASLQPGVPLQLQAQTSALEVITGVVASVPAGATAVVQLGTTVIPLSAGLANLTGMAKILGPTDTRSLLTAGGAGPASLWLTGVQLPTFGALAK